MPINKKQMIAIGIIVLLVIVFFVVRKMVVKKIMESGSFS